MDDIGLRQPTLDDVFLTLTGAAPTERAASPQEVAAMSVARPARRTSAAGNVARRHLGGRPPRACTHMRRQPEALADVTLQPVMFVLLFAYVFGGAINVPGGGYREFLMGGIFAQTIVFGAFGVAIALAYDRTNGAIDRFRSLPMARGLGAGRARRGEPAARRCCRSC